MTSCSFWYIVIHGGYKTMGKKRRKSKAKKSSKNIDLAVVSCFVLGILLTILIYAETGELGKLISPVLGGVIGVIKYILPLGIIGIGISLAKNDKDYLFSKVCQYIVFLSCVAAMIAIFQVSKGNLNLEVEFSDVLQRAYELGTKNIGGGTIGTVIAYPLIKLLGMFGAAVATTGIAVIMLVFTFGLKPSEFILEILERQAERREEKQMEKEALREERMARIRQQNKQARKAAAHAATIEEEKPKKQRKNIGLFSIDAEEETPEIDEEQITIHLNQQNQVEEPKIEKSNLVNLFHKKEQPAEVPVQQEPEKEVLNPNEIESNLFVQKAEEKEEKVKEVLQLEHNAMVAEDENYETPPVEFLKQGQEKNLKGGKKALADTATRLQKTLYSFGVSAKVENVSVGPAITRYELKPAEGVRVSKIAKLSDDIALNLAAESIRIEAPIPGKQAVRH